MKLLVVLLAISSVRVRASDDLWMELLSIQMIEADASYDDIHADRNIPALAGELGLTTLVDLVKDANLVDTLSGKGPFTLFGPSNDAFKDLPLRVLNYLKKNVTVLTEVLKYHVAAGKVLSKDLKNDMLITSAQGSNIRINIYKDNTVITASGRQVVKPDNTATNGVIHVVSGVLFPSPGKLNEILAQCDVFKTLRLALEKAGLSEVLSGDGPFTLFAPTERAFRRIPKECLKKLLDNKPLLTKVLTYHLVQGTYYSLGLSCGDTLKTEEGGLVYITKFFGRVKVNDARVLYADGTANNGVLYAIDRLLIPEQLDGVCSYDAPDYVDYGEPMKKIPFV